MTTVTKRRLRQGRVGFPDLASYSIGAISDFKALDSNGLRYTGVGELIFQFTAASDSTDEEYRLQKVGTATLSDWSDLEDLQNIVLSAPGEWWAQVRGIDGATKGPPSNIYAFSMPPNLVISKYYNATYLGNGNVEPGVTLSGVAAGKLCIVVCYARAPGNTFTETALTTSWEAIGFATETTTPSAIRAAWKVLDGSETILKLITTGSGATCRYNYSVWICDIVGGSVSLGTTPTVQATTGNPAAQTIHSGDAGLAAAVIAISAFGFSNSGGDQTFVGAAIRGNVVVNNTTTLILRNRDK